MNLFDGLEGETRGVTIQDELDGFQSFLSEKAPVLQIARQRDVLQWEAQHGVYLLFDENEQLLYVGYTLDGFEKRIADYEKTKPFKWFDLIVFPKVIEFLAPSLEF